MWILAIQKQHSGSICLLKDGEVVLYLLEERISRKKKFYFPFRSIQQIRKYTSKVDVVVFTGYEPITEQNQILFQHLINEGVVNPTDGWIELNHSHHLCHASNAFYNSGFSEALCIVWDGYGSSFKLANDNLCAETTSVYQASYPATFKPVYKRFLVNRSNIALNNDGIAFPEKHIANNVLTEDFGDCEVSMHYDMDLGTIYQTVSEHLGFGYSECGKTMGLAAYGESDSNIPPMVFKAGKDFYTNSNLFLDRFKLNTDLFQNLNPQNLAYALQSSVEEHGIDLIKRMLAKTGSKNLVISGGVGLNVCLNYRIRKEISEDVNIYIEPNCEDSGNSIGVAKFLWHSDTGDMTVRPLTTCYMGEEPTYQYTLRDGETERNVDYSDIADLLDAGNLVAVYQGKSEAGPRALGNRSILFDPRVVDGKAIVNTVKNREWFRPFAASILNEYANDWFDMAGLSESPYMMYAVQAKEGVKEKIPSVVHADNSCRVQTVTKEQNTHFYNLIKEFNSKTGIPLLFNTSFNLAGDPMVETMEDALDTLRRSSLEYLYLPEKKCLITVPNI